MTSLEKTLRWVVILGAFSLPFVCLIIADGTHFLYNLFFPYITGKNFTFRLIVEIMTGAWLVLALVNPKYRPRRSWVLGAFSIFVFLIALSDALGVLPSKSFWSNFERMDGWVTLAHLLAYFVVVVSILNTEKLWRRLLQVSLGVATFLAVYGFLQIAGDVALGQGGGGGLSARIDATFGNPIYLAVYMLFHIFIAAMLWAQMWRERGMGRRLPLSILYGFVIGLYTLSLLFTGTRGTMLGLFGGVALALLIYAFSSDASKRLRYAILGVYILGVVLAGSLWLARDTSIVKSVGFLDRLTSISLTDATIKARFLNMGIAWQGVKERPILGWGQENYAIVFDKYYDPRMYAQEPWFDRVHNSIFDWWIAGGTLGLLAYLSLFLAALWALWKSGAFDAREKAILTGLLAGYFAHNLTVFDNITSYILFATILGYIAWRASAARDGERLLSKTSMPEWSTPFIAVAALFLVWGSAWWVNAGALEQNRALIQAIQQQLSPSDNLNYFKEAVSYGTYGTQEAREQLAQIASRVAASSGIDTPTRQQFFDLATAQMAQQEKDSPQDARFPLFLGAVYNAYGDYADATAAFERARLLSPRKQTILFVLGQNQAAQGDLPSALQTFKTAYELAPDFNEARIYYAAGAIAAKDDALADQLLAKGGATDPRIVSAYAQRGRYDKIVEIFKAQVEANPTDTQAYFTLAAAYYQSGNAAMAISTLRSAAAANPTTKDQVEELIRQIEDGTLQIGQ
ncbi:MAG: O-antigen ligase family protein [Patescibacteria group bacterium]|nr:O-antigen ligase family protein [Patescibacteria group bacterium]